MNNEKKIANEIIDNSRNMEDDYGKEITLTEAEEIMDRHAEIKGRVVNKMKTVLKDVIEDQDAVKLLTSEYNAFIFSRKLVERFFKGDSKAKDPSEVASYLMVILGAHPKKDTDFEENDPTVLLVGCNRKIVGGKVTFVSLGRAKAADEHPPKIIVHDIPFKDNNDIATFTLK